MKVPRFRIAWVMLAVAITALDFGAIRALLEVHSMTNELLLVGALPMTNVLAVGILVGIRHPKNRPFLLGFEAFGAIALVVFVALATFFPDRNQVIDLYIKLLVEPMEQFVGRNRPFMFIPLLCVGLVIMLGWPQVAFAWFGGSLSRRFKINITPR